MWDKNNKITKRIKSCISLCLVTALLVSLSGESGIKAFDACNVSKVSAATKTKNLTKSIKVKNSSGIEMTQKEAATLTASSFKMLSSVMEGESKDANVLISPASILYAFGMAENGAKGKTRSQLEKTVNGGIKTGELNKILASTRKRMNADKNTKWNIANSVWYKKDKSVKVKKKFLKNVKSYYGAEVYRAAFNNGTVKDINSWVNKNTNKMIPKIIEQCDSSDVMYIINAMAFEGDWQAKFDEEQIKKDRIFTNADSSTAKVNMLSEKEGMYFELNGANGFRKNYEGGDYSYVGIEVPDGMTTAEYVKKLSKDGGAFTKALSNMKSANVYVEFPEYKLDYDVELSQNLKKLGAKNAFDKNKANLYNMFEKDKNSNYYFSAVLHKTFIEVDRKGTKAAAATAIVVSKATAIRPTQQKYVEIILDHPFVYAIVDNKTNLPVFVGCVNTLKEQ